MAVVGNASTWMVTVLPDEGQVPLLMVHCKVTLAPITNPVTPEVGEAGVVMVAVPDTTLHNPVPDAGVFPARVVVVTLHKSWLGPALDTVGAMASLIVTLEVDGAQGALLMVHTRVAEVPGTSPVTPEVGEAGVVMVAVPALTDQSPVPKAGVLADKLVVVTPHKF